MCDAHRHAPRTLFLSAQRRRLPDAPAGERWHLQHGPIDLVIQAQGQDAVVRAAHARAWELFQGILGNLVQELKVLKARVEPLGPNPLHGPIARSMWQACQPLAHEGEDGFITPMAAVAGAVAQAVLECYQVEGVERAWVNNGGDIALHLSCGQSVDIGLVSDLAKAFAKGAVHSRGHWRESQAIDVVIDGALHLDDSLPISGVATSGWRGRSHSRGIADSVTVLARTAAQADAGATMIANALNVEHPLIVRARADSLTDDSDLGSRWVTCDVPRLPPACVRQALERARTLAEDLRCRGLIWGALMLCQNQFEHVGEQACLV